MSNLIKREARSTKGNPTGYISKATRQEAKRNKKDWEKAKTKKIDKARKSKEELRTLIHADDDQIGVDGE